MTLTDHRRAEEDKMMLALHYKSQQDALFLKSISVENLPK
jgi:hypothetical protein